MSKWYDYNPIRSRNALFNMILGGRSIGKSYGAKTICIKKFLKTGEQFAYVRRYQTELDTRSDFFNDIVTNQIFPFHEFKVVGMKGFIREIQLDDLTGEVLQGSDNSNKWEICCHFICLNVSASYKSTPFPLVTTIIYDEFVLVPGVSKYLKNEPIIFLEMYNTIARPGAREDKVTCFLLANSVSLVNPYFSFWKFKINPNKEWYSHESGEIVVHFAPTPQAFKEAVLATSFGKIIAGTDYAAYSVDNESLMDNSSFICKRPSGQLIFFAGFLIEGKEIGIWKSREEGILFVDEKTDPSSKNIFTITEADHTVQYDKVQSLKRTSIIPQQLILGNKKGIIFFADLEVASYFDILLKYL